MSLTPLSWLFTSGVLLHNLEEALYLPGWSNTAGRWYRPVAPRPFRFADAIFSTLVLLITALASGAAARNFPAYLFAGYVLAMALNAIIPHLALTIVMRRYMPGTATALLLNLPFGILYLRLSLMRQHVSLHTFFWAGPLVVLAFLASLPILFAISRRL